MGLHIDIYKDSRMGDSTNGGVTSRFPVMGLTLVDVDGPFEPSEKYPAARLVTKTFGGDTTVRIVPEEEIEKGSWTMFGGNYGATSDSRFNDAVSKLLGSRFYGALPIHDRVEHY